MPASISDFFFSRQISPDYPRFSIRQLPLLSPMYPKGANYPLTTPCQGSREIDWHFWWDNWNIDCGFDVE